MKNLRTVSTSVAFTLLGLSLSTTTSCTSGEARQTAAVANAQHSSEGVTIVQNSHSIATPLPGMSTRIGGNLNAVVTGADGDFRFGPCRIDTPLPVGYPAPTPPGAMDLKTYPSVRLAEVTGSGNPDAGMNRAFWPLFRHISDHDIAMTSPVEMNYAGMGEGKNGHPASWSMSFLYRTPELNSTGTEGAVVVRDSDPITVLAVGMKGKYSMSLVERGMEQIEDWLAENREWEPAGNWRSLYYNGPTLMVWNKWAEVQLPVRRIQQPTASSLSRN